MHSTPASGRTPIDPELRSSASVEALIERAEGAERAGSRDEARVLYERALLCLPTTDAPRTASKLLRAVARTHQVDANFDAALDCIEAAQAIAEAAGDQASVGHAINLRAILHWQQGDIDQAEREYRAARESAMRSGEARLAAMTAMNLGVCASVRGDLEQARRYYETSLSDCRALGIKRDVLVALNNLGMLDTELQRWTEAERAFSEAVEISVAIGDVGAQILLQVNLAELHVARGSYEQARGFCDRAMEASQQAKDSHALGEAFKIYGIVARETGDAPAAEDYLLRAEKIAQERQDLILSAQVARELAELYRSLGRNRDTLRCLNRAYQIFTQLRARRDIADVQRRTGRFEGDFLEVVRRWGESIESKDEYTQGHCERVADLACALAAKRGMDEKSLFWFRIGALLHDVGKLMIPPEVLNKPGRLTEEEWVLMKRHTIAGVEIIAETEFPWDIRPIIESHHECWDGSGYPYGWAAEQIPVNARILCIADVYDALTSERSYKRALSHDEAMQIMRRDVGRQFDPTLFHSFEELFENEPSMERLRGPGTASKRGNTQQAPAPGDDLTGLPMRRAFLETAGRIVGDRKRTGRDASLLVVDIDHFKLVNDTYGHLQGDDVLRGVAEVLRTAARPNDFVARYAGDEFVMLLPETSLDEAREVAKRICDAATGLRCSLRGRPSETLAVTLSVGLAVAPRHGDTVESLFTAADRALYDAKRKGRNAFVAAADETPVEDHPPLELDRFVGRTRELGRLVQLLESSLRGEPHVVAVIGESGIGKTALLRQLAPDVRLRAGTLIVGRCHEADVKPPYGPWAEIIDALRLNGFVPSRPWRELPSLVPSLAQGLPAGVDRPTASKYALLEEISEFLRAAATSRPLVIVLEDVQWADSATLDTLEHLVTHLEHDRLLLCLTIRSEELLKVADRRGRLSRSPCYQEVTLARLGIAEVREWVATVFHSGELATQLPGLVHDFSEGNPLLAVQMVRSLLEEGSISYDRSEWTLGPQSEIRLPGAAADLVARRVARLSPDTRAILATAAVIGREFSVDLVIASGAGSENAVLDAIDEGLAAAVLEPVSGSEGERFAFTHGLLADAVRNSVNGRRLRRIRERVAGAIESHRPTALAEIAAQLDAAGDREKTHHYALRAGQRALRVYAYDEASSMFELARRSASTPGQTAEACYHLACVAEVAGEYEAAEGHCETALAAFAQLREPPARALPIRRLRERLGVLAGNPPDETRRRCEVLLAEAEADDNGAERAALLGMLAHAYGRLGDWAHAEQLAKQGVALATTLDDRRQLAESLVRLGTTLLEVRPRQALATYREALVHFCEADDRPGQVRCHINIGIALSRSGDAAAAETTYTVALTLGRAAHAPDLAGLASLNLGVLYLKGGQHEPARERFEDALELFTRVRNEPNRLAALYNLAHLAREQADALDAVARYDEVALFAGRIGQSDVEIGALAGAALAGMSLGKRDDARRWLEAIDAMIGTRDDWWFQGRELVEALRVRLALCQNDRPRAERAFTDAVAMAEARDPYGAAWLVAECAAPLAQAGASAVTDALDRFAEQADRLGYTPLSVRYAAARADR